MDQLVEAALVKEGRQTRDVRQPFDELAVSLLHDGEAIELRDVLLYGLYCRAFLVHQLQEERAPKAWN